MRILIMVYSGYLRICLIKQCRYEVTVQTGTQIFYKVRRIPSLMLAI